MDKTELKDTTTTIQELYEMVTSTKKFYYRFAYELSKTTIFNGYSDLRKGGELIARYGSTSWDPKDLNEQYEVEVYKRDAFLSICEEYLKGLKKAQSHKTTLKQDAINPTHYNGTQTLDRMVAVFGVDAVINFCEINAFKYRMRAGKKENNPIEQDIKKALWYEGKAKELKRNDNE